MNGLRQIGKHTLELRGDVQLLQIHGDISEKDVREMIPIGEALTARYGYYLSISDARKAGNLSPEARRCNAEWVRDHPDSVGLSVVHGAGLAVRVVVSLAMRATALLSKRPYRVAFADSEEEALALVDAERPRLRAEAIRRGWKPPADAADGPDGPG